jgi:hypothetical protein
MIIKPFGAGGDAPRAGLLFGAIAGSIRGEGTSLIKGSAGSHDGRRHHNRYPPACSSAELTEKGCGAPKTSAVERHSVLSHSIKL